MTTPTVTETRRNGHQIADVGERIELARYTAGTRQRALYGQRIHGVVRVVDRPLHGPGRSYLVERGLEQDGYAALQALVIDYVSEAAKHHTIPAADSPVDRYLENVP
jgi:hypothetical protein